MTTRKFRRKPDQHDAKNPPPAPAPARVDRLFAADDRTVPAAARVSTALRIPADLHQQLVQAALERDVSVNWLIVKAIEDFLPRLVPADRMLVREVDPT